MERPISDTSYGCVRVCVSAVVAAAREKGKRCLEEVAAD